jgi:hypothetical protein
VDPDDCIEQLVNLLKQLGTIVLILFDHLVGKWVRLSKKPLLRLTWTDFNNDCMVFDIGSKKGVLRASETAFKVVNAVSKQIIMLLKRS